MMTHCGCDESKLLRHMMAAGVCGPEDSLRIGAEALRVSNELVDERNENRRLRADLNAERYKLDTIKSALGIGDKPNSCFTRPTDTIKRPSVTSADQSEARDRAKVEPVGEHFRDTTTEERIEGLMIERDAARSEVEWLKAQVSTLNDANAIHRADAQRAEREVERLRGELARVPQLVLRADTAPPREIRVGQTWRGLTTGNTYDVACGDGALWKMSDGQYLESWQLLDNYIFVSETTPATVSTEESPTNAELIKAVGIVMECPMEYDDPKSDARGCGHYECRDRKLLLTELERRLGGGK